MSPREELVALAQTLDVALDALEERDGLALHPAYRGAVRAVAAWEGIEAAKAAAYAAPIPRDGRGAAWCAWYLVAEAVWVDHGNLASPRTMHVTRARAKHIARAAFGDRGDALVAEAWATEGA